MTKKLVELGRVAGTYTTTGPLEDKTDKLVAWMNWCHETMVYFQDGKTDHDRGCADGLKLAMARFMAEFKKEEL